ncbi:MAG: NADH:ubiquinone reductase (Na(+)-transporting) subunit D [Planctomycetota bacterium]|nr:MAG: NADH:ubiquinone reductase (Na(+)-transporting) subunit D [Planctomycetota bacterium]
MADLKKTVLDPLWDENPITFTLLGICSALAVTGNCIPAFTMACSLTVVVALSNLIISLLRNVIPPKVEIIIQLVVIAALVIIADQLLKAYMYEVSLKLSVFVGLIITNCIVLGRAKAFAMANPPLPSFLDGLSNGIGYSIILMFVATIREILGPGTWFGINVLKGNIADYVPNGVMVLPPAAFFCIGIFIWIQRSLSPKLVKDD